MADRKPTKTGICIMDLKIPLPESVSTLRARLDRCENICEHYCYCQHVTDMNDRLKELED